MSDPRILFAAPSSGSGKTTITCGVLQALKERGKKVFSFKCGPDYIDPMFQERVIGVPSGTLDLFFSEPDTMRRLFKRNAADAEISVIEGVMGYYDGLGAATDEASSFRVAEALNAPVVLIVDARGQSLSALATLQGFLKFRPDSRVRGVIFNRMSEHVYRALKPEVEKLGVQPLGFLPKSENLMIESRHLGLVTPGEIDGLSEKLHKLAETLENTLDLDALIALAEDVQPIEAPPEPVREKLPKVRIAAAKDEAFCFWYRDNLNLLKELGAELLFFSPIHDERLPEGAQGLILPGGYPELYAEALSRNAPMLESVACAVKSGLPCLAECGGFLYLHRELEDMKGAFWPLCGVIDAKAWKTNRLGRFGYITLSPKAEGNSEPQAGTASEPQADGKPEAHAEGFLLPGETIRAHEFHYYESGDCGCDLTAKKPVGTRSWECIHAGGSLFAGFPHLFYESNPQFVMRFLRRAAGEE